MNKTYYTISETLMAIQNQGGILDMEGISSYVRERLINPIIYIDSIPVHACELGKNGQALAMGACLLSAYWNIGDDIVAVFDILLRKQLVQVNYVVKKEQLITERIMGWDSRLHMFEGVPHEHISPRPYSKDLPVYCYIFFADKLFEVSIKNIFISQKDMDFLNAVCIKQDTLHPKNKDEPPKNYVVKDASAPKSRRHELHEVIKLAYKTEKIKLNRAPTNTEVWRIVQKPEYDTEEIINDVTNTHIEWTDWKAQPREMKRSTFNNFITSLKTGTKT